MQVTVILHLTTVGSLIKKVIIFEYIYRILAPMVIFKLMRRRLTLFDLKLNFYFNTQYTLAKILYRTFSKDFKIAECIAEYRLLSI